MLCGVSVVCAHVDVYMCGFVGVIDVVCGVRIDARERACVVFTVRVCGKRVVSDVHSYLVCNNSTRTQQVERGRTERDIQKSYTKYKERIISTQQTNSY